MSKLTNHEKLFLLDLKELLIKHKVGISSSDEYPGYPECGEDIRIRIESEWKDNPDMDIFLNFGSSIDSELIDKTLKDDYKKD